MKKLFNIFRKKTITPQEMAADIARMRKENPQPDIDETPVASQSAGSQIKHASDLSAHDLEDALQDALTDMQTAAGQTYAVGLGRLSRLAIISARMVEQQAQKIEELENKIAILNIAKIADEAKKRGILK